ncbi:MAG: hypothetical protein SFZ03_11285 [Candidatus Melainabacteria bacterium]|nr:hypothetical protein [Candidatus Melainabacteria bacterium]
MFCQTFRMVVSPALLSVSRFGRVTEGVSSSFQQRLTDQYRQLLEEQQPSKPVERRRDRIAILFQWLNRQACQEQMPAASTTQEALRLIQAGIDFINRCLCPSGQSPMESVTLEDPHWEDPVDPELEVFHRVGHVLFIRSNGAIRVVQKPENWSADEGAFLMPEETKPLLHNAPVCLNLPGADGSDVLGKPFQCQA